MKYVKCDCCDSKIDLGNVIYQKKELAAIFCSGACYAETFAFKTILTEDEADNCYAEILEK